MKRRSVGGTVLRMLGMVFCGFWIWAALAPLSSRVFNIASVILLIFFVPPLILLSVPRSVRRLCAVKFIRILLRIVCVIYICIFVCAAILSVRMVHSSLKTPPAESDAVCIVLGCQVNGECDPSPILAGRLEAALAYLQSHPAAKCVVTGCQGPDEDWSEASVMRKWLIRAGIDAERIYSEELSRNTQENLHESARVIRENGLPETAVIATDWWHQHRASIWARRERLAVYAVSSAVPREGVWNLDALYFARELLGLVYTFMIPQR